MTLYGGSTRSISGGLGKSLSISRLLGATRSPRCGLRRWAINDLAGCGGRCGLGGMGGWARRGPVMSIGRNTKLSSINPGGHGRDLGNCSSVIGSNLFLRLDEGWLCVRWEEGVKFCDSDDGWICRLRRLLTLVE